jgi:signal transduction histidine kinase/ligand-binding sensor domain-containing protein/DNA-binding response OmpR family regulator
MNKIGLLAIFIVSFLGGAFANNVTFKHLTANDGLLSNNINAVLQDSYGFMWFGTKDGLCRYDGYSYLNFFHAPGSNNSLSNNVISCLVEDVGKNIWIGTRNGLNRFRLESFEVERVPLLPDEGSTLFPIQSLTVSSDNKLWIGTDEMGLFVLDIATNHLTNYTYFTDSSSIENAIYSILEIKDHQFYISTSNGVYLFNDQTKNCKRVIENVDARILRFDQDSSILVGAFMQGNYYYKIKRNGAVEKINISISSTNKNLIPQCDSFGNIWLGIGDIGLLFFDAKRNTEYLFTYDKYNSTGISSNAITSFCEDKWGNMWVGTYDSGVNLYERRAKAFVHVKDNFLPNGLRNNKVRAMFSDSDGDIWIGTKINGTLSKFNRDNLTFTHYIPNPSDPNALSNDLIFCITEDKPGFLWIGTANGLDLFEKKTGKTKVWFHDPNNANSLESNVIYALFKDDNKLYIGYFLEGFGIYDTELNSFKIYQQSDDSTSISDNKVRVFHKDRNGNLWIGTLNGLNLFHPETGTFTSFKHQVGDSTSISDNIIQCICEDKNSNLWIGTMLGVNFFDPGEKTFKTYTTSDGLPGNSVQGILEDDEGCLWISTNNGLSKFDPITEKFKNYNTEDGLQAKEFSTNVFCKTSTGEMLFGGDNGFNIFQPSAILDNEIIPDVFFTGFKLFNKEVDVQSPDSPLKKHISSSTEITLTHKQSVFSVEYVALNYASPEKNQYAYRLEGFEYTWNEVGTKREATYTNLNAGTYVFRVKASNNDGLWNQTGAALIIKVLPPIWLTWWAYAFYFILFLVLVFVFRHYITKRVRAEKEHEQDVQNLHFFMNVSHEFRTPLTLILNPLQELLASKTNGDGREALENINLSANKLLHLVNQLLDFRKTDLGRLPLRVAKTNIVDYSQKIVALFDDISASKQLTLQFHSPERNIEVWLDADKYEIILNNLLSNAIKFTTPGGNITLSVAKKRNIKKTSFLNRFREKNSSDYVEISVKDTGIGLGKTQIEHVFERFYSSSDDTKTGIGIGLNYTKSLVALHGGEICVESTLGAGSNFIVKLPLGNGHFKSDQLSSQASDSHQPFLKSTGIESLKYDLAASDGVWETETVTDHEQNEPRNRPLLLVVEDNKRLRQQIQHELQPEFEVKQAKTGQEGWELAKIVYPDIIVSDVMMPVMDGIEMCKLVKTTLETCHIPIILLTAKNLVEDKILGYQTGADDYISKPFNMSLLKVRIKNLIAARLQLKEKYSSAKTFIPAKDFTNNNLDEVFLDKLTHLILDNLTDAEFTQQKLEEKMGMSRSGLYKKINNLTGTSTSVFIRNVKLKNAAQLLVNTNYPIKEIVYLAGFNSPSYFTSSFRKLFGQTPQDYAKQKGENN